MVMPPELAVRLSIPRFPGVERLAPDAMFADAAVTKSDVEDDILPDAST